MEVWVDACIHLFNIVGVYNDILLSKPYTWSAEQLHLPVLVITSILINIS